jgi:hypothetical protein
MKEKPNIAIILCFVGSILMLANVLLVGINNGPLILYSGAIQSPNDIMDPNAPLWFRISFGLKRWVESFWAPFWVVVTFINLYCITRLYFKPLERKALCTLIALLSILCLLYGGGFIIGTILGVLGAGIGFSWPAKLENTFFYKIIEAAKLDSFFYKRLKEDEDALKHAVYCLVFVNVLSGIGGGFYSYWVQTILNATSIDIPFKFILLGDTVLDMKVIPTVIINVGLALLKWIVFSFIIYIIAFGLLERKQTLSNIAAIVAFAYVPVSLQFVMPFLLTNVPNLSFTWPFFVFMLTNLWMVLALIMGLKHTLEISLGKTLGVFSISSAIYILLKETFFAAFEVPYLIQFSIQPQFALVMIVSSLSIVSVLLGTFSKR